MISATEFRNGITVEIDGDVFIVVEFQHVKPGKGAAFVRARLKNLKAGGIVERTFRPTDKMPRAHIDRKNYQYLYKDGDLYHFMDPETYEQTAINAADVGNSLQFVKENEMVNILAHNSQVFGIEPPLFVDLEITDTEPGFRGDTATNATKAATLETGAIVKVPLFLSTGDRIQVDTRTGEYLKRV
ncbi:MAG: elongation factor P [Clostridiales bacterium]|jgi:elongation factor P|nr:elongation factor P [Clostridiales bacterium]